MQPDDRVRPYHMRDAAKAAVGFVGHKERTSLDNDQMLLFAVVRAIEVVGEAASRVSGVTRTEFSSLPWRAASAMRNRLIHGYFDIDSEVVWATVTQEFPILIRQLTEILGEECGEDVNK